MRLHLTLPEIEEGRAVQSGPNERILDLQMLINNQHPVAIVPTLNHDHKIISSVVLIDAEQYSSNTLKVRFKPFWCKTFTLCSAKKDSLLAVIMQFEDGQYWVDKDGWRECRLTLDGPGTDPKTVYNSQFLLGDLLANHPRPRLIDSVIELIQKKHLLCQEEERKKDAILT
jgi:hypothetical protein